MRKICTGEVITIIGCLGIAGAVGGVEANRLSLGSGVFETVVALLILLTGIYIIKEENK